VISDPGDWQLDLLELHLEELISLWPRRPLAWRTHGFSVHSLRMLDERLDAHADALALAADDAAPMLDAPLHAEDPIEVLAAALPLLRGGLADQVVEAFTSGPAPALSGFATAFAYAMAEERSGLALSPEAHVVLSRAADSHRPQWLWARAASGGPVSVSEVRSLLGDPDATVRARAWQTISASAAEAPDLRSELAPALEDVPAVRVAALEAVAWTRQRGLLEKLRALAAEPSPAREDALRLVAILGGAEDLQLLREALADTALGPGRFELAGQLGHPALVDLLLPVMSGEDPLPAVSAGRSFERITGIRLPSNRTAQIHDDEDEAEEIQLPDADAARRGWAKVKGSLGGSSRLQWGIAVERGLTPAIIRALDLPALAEAMLRDAFHGKGEEGAASLQRFPWPEE
jgi:hypothetical protein